MVVGPTVWTIHYFYIFNDIFISVKTYTFFLILWVRKLVGTDFCFFSSLVLGIEPRTSQMHDEQAFSHGVAPSSLSSLTF